MVTKPPSRTSTLIAVAIMIGSLLYGSAALAGPAAAADPATIGDVTNFERSGSTYTLSAGEAKVRVAFHRDDIVRVWLAPDGNFTDPANEDPGGGGPDADILARTDFGPVRTRSWDAGDRYVMSTGGLRMIAYKKPLRFELRRADGSLVWAENAGLSWTDDSASQSLARGATEQFVGGGMQNGRFSHRGDIVKVAANYNWEDGGYPNAVPYYMSSNGYGVLRNTFAPGDYAFTEPVRTTHREKRFDAIYYVAPRQGDIKSPLEGYTAMTGRPMMPPVYGLELGDADCYNTANPDSQHPPTPGKLRTPDAIKVAQQYADHDMPRGWMLVNDGYGCGYVDLPQTGDGLRQRGIELGLWTQSKLDNQEFEVREAGVRVRKLDVAWVGPGYRHALTACQDAHDGIERHSDARGYAWMVEGWAGAQRCAVQWTGDHSGTLDAIRWQIPAIHGSGNSGLPYTAGDIDGIFGGSAESYVRDLQWKVFTPVLMTMSGWADSDKQPWRYGEPYTSINRKYLKLRERLLPYFYTLAAEAHRTGTPIVRSLAMEYPREPMAWDDSTAHQFLVGRDLLVAPVLAKGEERSRVYLPRGRWVDYWTGKIYRGGQVVNGYRAPLDTLPLFVRAGAVVPMWKQGINHHREHAAGDRLTFDVYPDGTSSYDLYEDDGRTRGYAQGRYARQNVTARASHGMVRVDVAAPRGSYDGMAASRPYELLVHSRTAPRQVWAGTHRLPALGSAEAYEKAGTGWWRDGDGVVRVKTPSTSRGLTVMMPGASAVGGAEQPAAYTTAAVPAEMEPGAPAKVTATFTNNDASDARDVRLAPSLPDGWQAAADGPTSFPRVRKGATVTAAWQVTPPADAKVADHPIKVTTSFTMDRGRWTAGDSGTTRTLPAPPAGDAWAGDMEWVSATNGWGPVERDTANGESAAGDGGPIALDGVKYDKGLGVHAESRVRFFLGGRCTRLAAKVGVDDSRNGSVTFQVLKDGAKAYDSGRVVRSTATIDVDQDVSGARMVDLVVTDSGDGKNADHADWASARFTCGGGG